MPPRNNKDAKMILGTSKKTPFGGKNRLHVSLGELAYP
jgi:hypothetical protein